VYRVALSFFAPATKGVVFMPLQFYSFAFFPYPAVNHDCKALLEARAIKASGCECSAVPYQRNDPYDAILFAKRDIERTSLQPRCTRND